MNASFLSALSRAPLPYNRERATGVLSDIGASLDPILHPLIEGVAGCSPYLARSLSVEVAFLATASHASADETIVGILTETRAAVGSETQDALMQILRVQKRRAALFIALCDLGGAWPQEKVLRAISDFADVCIAVTAEWLLRDYARREQLPLDPVDPVGSSGLAILGLGKLGAHELNYSSDVDLILFFDAERFPPDAYAKVKQKFNQLTRQFVKILSDQTADGYVHRVDLNWERAAFIKARVIGGDIAAGEAFLEGIVPFVWRKYLDFATIEDVRNMKSLIHKHKGHGEIAVAGHNIKLGRGGIREIEFFAQTQQLIAGGREPALRQRGTLDTLQTLQTFGWIEKQARDELSESYQYLRDLEHRLQMVSSCAVTWNAFPNILKSSLTTTLEVKKRCRYPGNQESRFRKCCPGRASPSPNGPPRFWRSGMAQH